MTPTPPKLFETCLTLTAHCTVLYLKPHLLWESQTGAAQLLQHQQETVSIYLQIIPPQVLFFFLFFSDAFNVIISVTGLSNSLPLASSEPKTFGTLNEPFNFMSYPTCALSVWYPAAFIVINGAAGLKSATMFGKRLRSESQTPLGKSPSHLDTFLYVLQNCIFKVASLKTWCVPKTPILSVWNVLLSQIPYWFPPILMCWFIGWIGKKWGKKYSGWIKFVLLIVELVYSNCWFSLTVNVPYWYCF